MSDPTRDWDSLAASWQTDVPSHRPAIEPPVGKRNRGFPVRRLIAFAIVIAYVAHAIHTMVGGPLVPALAWNGIVGLLLAVAAALLLTQRNLDDIAANCDMRTFVELSLAAARRETQGAIITTIALLALVTIVMEWPRVAPRPGPSVTWWIVVGITAVGYGVVLFASIRSVRRASAALRQLRAELDESGGPPSDGHLRMS